MTQVSKTLTIRSSPHIGAVSSVDTIMFNVVLAMMPVCIFAVYAFGLAALLVLLTAVASCVLTEHLLCKFNGLETTVGDWSAAITGILYGLTLPPSLPLWMVAAGGMIGIGVAKFLFGGLGYNVFNPALIGRAILQAAFPAAMTTWPVLSPGHFSSLPSSTLAMPLTKPVYTDGISGATPLSDWKFNHAAAEPLDLLMGSTLGSTGETCALLILMGGIYLVARKMMSWRIPVAILATVAVFSTILNLIDSEVYAGPMFMLFSGGLMLGAVFMATDMVASPMTHLGCIVYGVLIGLLVVLIRVWGGMPEGVMYAILIGNAASPHIDNWIQPKVYGQQREVAPHERLRTSRRHRQRAGAAQIYGVVLTLGVVCALAIVSVYEFTKPIIRLNQIALRQRAILKVLPGAGTSVAFRVDETGQVEETSPDAEGSDLVFAGFDDAGQLVGLAIETQGMGYQDVIRLLYGYSFEKQAVIGTSVLESRETPGLGDRIEKDANFLSNFESLDVRLNAEGTEVAHPIKFVKPGEKTEAWQIDGITGATISSKALAKMLQESTAQWIPLVHSRRSEFVSTNKEGE